MLLNWVYRSETQNSECVLELVNLCTHTWFTLCCCTGFEVSLRAAHAVHELVCVLQTQMTQLQLEERLAALEQQNAHYA